MQNVDNLIVLCPTHHRLVDMQPQNYSADYLKNCKYFHEKLISELVKGSNTIKMSVKPAASKSHLTYSAALNFWHNNRKSDEEELWQTFFKESPRILALALPDDIIMIGEKCYLGGKDWTNRGGSVVDFLMASRQTFGVTIIEIKTPQTKIMGEEYRNNVKLPSKELVGSVMQVWSYRDVLLKNYHAISAERGLAFHPKCLVVIGDIEQQDFDQKKIRSFELFRNSLNNTSIITFDSLFSKVATTCDLLAGDD